MVELLTTIRRKIFGVPTPSELDKDVYEQEETLEEWKLDVENKFLKVHGNKVNEDPYVTYFFKYCQCCYDFRPGACFHESGIIKSENMLECSELRVNIKKLDGRK